MQSHHDRRTPDSEPSGLALVGRRAQSRLVSAAQTARAVIDSEKAIWGILLIGALLRIYQYASNRSLWYDEAMVVQNILGRSYADLLRPLDLDQVAPFGFLLLEKVAVGLLGGTEYALRLVPLLCGIASLLLFYRVARSFLERWALLTALTLFSFSYRLVYYSSEVKPYILDVATLLVLLLATLPILGSGFTRGRAVLLGAAGAVAVWLSFTAVFVLAGVGLCIVLDALLRRRPRALLPASVALGGAAISFLAMYFFAMPARNNNYLLDYWDSSFLPLPPTSVADIHRLDDAFFQFFQSPVGLFPSSVAALCAVVGGVAIAASGRMKLLLLVSPVCFVLLASALRLYPFSDRLLLFLVPIALILVSEGAVSLGVGQRRLPGVNAALVVALLAPVIAYSLFARPLAYYNEDIRTILAHVREQWREGDLIYVHYASVPAFSYYSERYGFDDRDSYLGQRSHHDRQTALDNELGTLDRHRRVWVVFSHIRVGGLDEERYTVSYLGRGRKKLESFTAAGAVVHLFSESASP
jgi:hypothetical protein